MRMMKVYGRIACSFARGRTASIIDGPVRPFIPRLGQMRRQTAPWARAATNTVVLASGGREQTTLGRTLVETFARTHEAVLEILSRKRPTDRQ
jgi:hypothetical protein